MSTMLRVISALSAALLLLAPAPATGQQDEYAVGARDILTVTVWGQDELSGKYTVGADGDIAFPLVGRVKVAGQTVRAIETTLVSRLAAGFLKNPQVTVEVSEYRSQTVFVIGEVRTPGPLPLTGGTTLLEALARAGALTERAGGDLLLLRPAAAAADVTPVLPGAPGVTEVVRVDVQELQRGDISDNTRLRHGDTIFVPRAATFDILGQVRNPGQYAIAKGLTVLRAISLAGGVTPLGTTRRVKIIRIVDGKKTERTVKLDELVQPGDTIMVPTRFL